jgi:hypothetical protein
LSGGGTISDLKQKQQRRWWALSKNQPKYQWLELDGQEEDDGNGFVGMKNSGVDEGGMWRRTRGWGIVGLEDSG